jgi:tetratricopeptide repeat protein
VCGADLDTLESLVDKSLVQHQDGRYALLEVLREFAAGALETGGDAESVRSRRREQTLSFAEAIHAGRLAGRVSVSEAAQRLAAEEDDLRASLAEFYERGDRAAAARLAGSLNMFWVLGHVREGSEWLARLLETRTALPDEPRARLLTAAAEVAKRESDWPGVRAWLTEAAELYRALGDDRLLARSLVGLAEEAIVGGRHEEAGTLLQGGRELASRHGDEERLAGIATAEGHLALDQGDGTEARCRFEEALEGFRRLGNDGGVGITLSNLGVVALAGDRPQDAKSLFAESLGLLERVPLISVSESLTGLAAIAAAEGRDDSAVTLFAAAQAWRDDVGQAGDEWEHDVQRRTLAALRTRLPGERYDAAWAAGLSMATDRAVALALREAGA